MPAYVSRWQSRYLPPFSWRSWPARFEVESKRFSGRRCRYEGWLQPLGQAADEPNHRCDAAVVVVDREVLVRRMDPGVRLRDAADHEGSANRLLKIVAHG